MEFRLKKQDCLQMKASTPTASLVSTFKSFVVIRQSMRVFDLKMRAGFIGSGLGTVARALPRRAVCTLHHKAPTMAADKMLHAVYRVGDLSKTRSFLEALGMKVLRERDNPAEKYSNMFFGFGSERKGEYFSLELTYNYGVDSYDIGTGFGHVGVAVSDCAATVEKVREAGFKVTREPGPVKGGTTFMAFVEDPTGYKFEILERKQRDPLCQVMLRVADLDKSIAFYQALGMKLLRKRDNEQGRYTLAFMGFGEEHDCTVLELTYNWGDHSYTNGNGYGQIAVSTPDVYAAAEQLKKAGIELAREPGPVPGVGTKICAVKDPDGWKTVLVDEQDFEKEFE